MRQAVELVQYLHETYLQVNSITLDEPNVDYKLNVYIWNGCLNESNPLLRSIFVRFSFYWFLAWIRSSNESVYIADQLNEIRKTKLSRLVCDNSDKIEEVQVYVMVLPDHDM
jgi:hypothetical protein